MTTPSITIYVRHSADCKHAGDELAKRCNCKKWLRWTHQGKRTRQPAGTRSWAEAEEKKRVVEDQLSGRAATGAESNALAGCIETFLADKRVQGIGEAGIAKYARELGRLKDY